MKIPLSHQFGNALCLALIVLALNAYPALVSADPNFLGKTDRPLRYRPDGVDFVIENGAEYFNRPLYIRNTAMRVDAGDRPQFSLFLPGRGGNFRVGIRVGKIAKWLDLAEKIVGRYRPGEMLYDIHDSVLSEGSITIHLLTLADTDGFIVRVEPHDLPAGAEVVFAFGGANGDKGKRNGDIGCENVTVSEFFRFKPEYCRDNLIQIDADPVAPAAANRRGLFWYRADRRLAICKQRGGQMGCGGSGITRVQRVRNPDRSVVVKTHKNRR